MPKDQPTSELEYIFVDFESFYSKEYTLKKLDTPSYILDPRFEATCLGVAEGVKDRPYLVDGPNIQTFFDSLRGRRVAMVSHHALFDMCIASWQFGYVPDLILDTMAMARTLRQHCLDSVSLDAVAAHFGMQKGKTLYKVVGMTRADIIAAGLWPEYTNYCLNDTELCRQIFLRLLPELPVEEIVLQDMIARCAVEPVFRLNEEVLATNLGQEQARKAELFSQAAALTGLQDEGQLQSNPQFAELLKTLGVDPPMKFSKKTEKWTYAFSKGDRPFLELLESDDPSVATLVEARLAHKSTGEETRTHRMLNIGRLEFFPRTRKPETGLMPIPLMVGAAITHRLGGGWQLNPQNWGRKSPIRKSIMAPPGHLVVTADSRQIEARMNAWFCGQDDLLEEFRKGVDVYASFASTIYQMPIDKNQHPKERFVGKTGILQLGYQAAWRKFQLTVWLLSYHDEGGPVQLPDGEAQRTVYSYRNRMSKISGMWNILPQLFNVLVGIEPPRQFGVLRVEKGRIVGPNGLCLYYDNLKFDFDGWRGEWTYEYNGYTYKIYGGKMLENIIQFLARIAVMQAAVRLKKPLAEYSTRLTHSSHDEIVYAVPEKYVDPVTALLRQEMKRPPAWAPTLPLDVDIGVGLSYGDAK
jgi:DNA polymerase